MENTSQKLYNILGTKFDNTDIKTLDLTGKETTDMEDVGMFSFDFKFEGTNYGPVVILISSDDNLEVYYGDNTSKRLDRNAKKKWENLIEHLSTFSRSHRLGFNLKHTTDLKYDLSNVANITEAYKNIFEGYYGTNKTSYNKQGKAKIIIKHSRKLGEEDKRFRNISQLFIENADGERFKLPFKKLAGARAMARHVTEGGNPYDLFGVHICEMVKDINTLGGFVRRSKMFEDDDDTSGLVETGRTHYASLRKGLTQIAGKRGYHTFKESWKPEEITTLDEDTDAIRSKFMDRKINSKIEEAIPLLARFQKMAEATSEEDEFVNHDDPDQRDMDAQRDADYDEHYNDDDDPHPYNMPESMQPSVIENTQPFKYGDKVRSISNPGGVYEVVGFKGDIVRVQSASDMFYVVPAADLQIVNARYTTDHAIDEGIAQGSNWFETLNAALESEGLISAWDSMTMGGINYGETKSWNAVNDAGQCEHITIYRETDGRYERPVHYASKMCDVMHEDTPTSLETYNKIKGFSLLAIKGYARRIGLPADAIGHNMDEEDYLNEIMGFLHGDSWEQELLAVGGFNEMDEITEFSEWATEIVEGNYDEPLEEADENIVETPDSAVIDLKTFFSKEQPVGVDAMNVTSQLQAIDNEDLNNALSDLAAKDSTADARQVVRDWLSDNRQELANQLNLHSEHDTPASRDFQREGLDTELDADSSEQLAASVNKELDKHVRECEEQYKTTGDNMNKLFTEYVAEAEDDYTDCEHCGQHTVHDGECTSCHQAADGSSIEETVNVNEDYDYDDEEDMDMCPHCDKPLSRAEMMGDHIENCEGSTSNSEMYNEATVEVGEPSGPMITMENDDLGVLMQRTNHLLRK